MNLDVNQDNLYLFLPGKIANVASIIAANAHCSTLEAMQRFYASVTYQGLEKEETKLWHLAMIDATLAIFSGGGTRTHDLRIMNPTL